MQREDSRIRHQHAAFAFIGGLGVHLRSLFLRHAHETVPLARLGGRLRGHDGQACKTVAETPHATWAASPLPGLTPRTRAGIVSALADGAPTAWP